VKEITPQGQSLLNRHGDNPTVQALAALAVAMLSNFAPDSRTKIVAATAAAGSAYLFPRLAEHKRGRARELLDEIQREGLQLTKEQIESGENLHMFEKSLDAAINTGRSQKIQSIARLYRHFASGMVATSTIDTFDEMLRILDDLSFRETQALFELRELERRYGGEDVNPTGRAFALWSEFLEGLEKIGIPIEQSGAFLQRLTRTGFYRMFTEEVFGVGDKGQTTPSLDAFIAMIQGPRQV